MISAKPLFSAFLGTLAALALFALVGGDILTVDRNGTAVLRVADTGATSISANDGANAALTVAQNGAGFGALFNGGFLGINTATPGAMLNVVGGAFSDSYGTEGNFRGRRANGTTALPTDVIANDVLVTFGATGYVGGGFASTAAGRMRINASENWDSNGHGTFISFATTPNASVTSPPERMRIDNDGHVKIGSGAPAASAAMEVESTSGAILIPRMTTAQRDALTAANGMVIYNTSTNAFNFYENGSWVTK